MAILKCKMCGGNLQIEEGMSVCECEYCGSKQTVPSLDNEKKVNLFTRANRLRLACEFDKAFGVYENIVSEFQDEAEAYWGLVLCKYGIEYVDDPKTGKKIPTCHRSSFDSIFKDPDFEMVMEYSDSTARSVYREEVKTIEDIRVKIIDVSLKEEPYDIFICYKETAEDGQRTIDSVIAQDVYKVLTEEGYRVFFSRISLEDKLGQEYEPYIFAALNSAKVMLAFGTDYEYYNAVWVKNEWSRFLSLIEKGEKKILIPCYKDIDAYDIPEEFKRLQAQDMGKVGAIQDLTHGIEKILGKRKDAEINKVIAKNDTTKIDVATLLERGKISLEDGEWENAEEFFEKVLNVEPKNAEAYFGKFMCNSKISTIEDCINKFTMEEAVEYEELTVEVPLARHIREMSNEYTIQGYLNVSEAIRTLYSVNTTYTSKLCFFAERKRRVLEEISNDKMFARAKQYASGNLENRLNEILNYVEKYYDDKIELYEKEDNDNIKRINAEYKEKIAEIDEKIIFLHDEALKKRDNEYQSLVSKLKYEKNIDTLFKISSEFEKLYGYKDAQEYINQIQKLIKANKRKKRISLIGILVGILTMIGIAGSIVFWFMPNSKYVDALNYMKCEEYEKAYNLFEELENFRDSEQMKDLCGSFLYGEGRYNALKYGKKGDIYTFGKYSQSVNADTKTDIEWIILDRNGNNIMLISKNYVTCDKNIYQNAGLKDLYWTNSKMRDWLNGEFYGNAFNEQEKKLINTTYIKENDMEIYDKVFLLNDEEAETLFSSSAERVVDGNKGWYLRSLFSVPSFVGKDGNIYSFKSTHYYNYVTNFTSMRHGIRPVIWINLEG